MADEHLIVVLHQLLKRYPRTHPDTTMVVPSARAIVTSRHAACVIAQWGTASKQQDKDIEHFS